MSRHSTTRGRAFRPGFETLEDRSTPAQFGVPWTEPMHLTLSFAPDGTNAAGEASQLFARLDSQLPRTVWQGEILRAFQAWAELANLNVGVTSDGGQAFGVAGATQGDSRFGDIRVGGLPMTAEALAVSIPPASFVSGTFAGDVFMNTAATFTRESLYAVALHEAGHALGLPHSTNPQSVMFSHLNQNGTLSAGDVAAIRALYGPRLADVNEGKKGNSTFKNATRIKYSAVSAEFDGSTPVVAYGDLTTRTDTDIFFLKGFPGYTGPISFRVQTTGISLLTPRVTVYDAAGDVLSQSLTAGATGTTLTLTIPNSIPDDQYFVKVEAAPNAPHKIGRFAIGATFVGLLRPTALSLDEVLRGPYENLRPEEMHYLFRDPDSVFFDDDLHTNDTVAFAVNLKPGPGQPSETHLRATASLSDTTDVDFYRVKSPKSGASWVFTASVRDVGANGIVPRIEVFDGNLSPIPTQILVNGNNTFTIQAPAVAPNANVFVRVASPSGAGNYALDVTFGTAAAELRTFAATTLPAATQASYKLYVGKTQLFSLGLSVAGATGAVRMDIVNAIGAIVASQLTTVGDTTTGVSTLLTPGEYTVRFTTVGATGPLIFSLRGSGLGDPVGPVKDSTTLTPQYVAPNDPNQFLYPNGTLTSDPFLWLFEFFV